MTDRLPLRPTLSLWLILLGPALATAFPIQNLTDTDIDTTQGVNLVLLGSGLQKIDGSYDGSGKSYFVGSFWTKTIDVDTADPSPAPGNQGYTGNQLFTGTGATNRPAGPAPADGFFRYRTFCMELTEAIRTSDAKWMPTTIETVPPVGALDQNGSPYAPNSPDSARRAAWVIAYADTVGTVQKANVENAAIQLAIWEIMYEAGTSATGDVTSGSIFRASGSNANQLAALARANELLAASYGQIGQGFVLRQNFRYDYAGPPGTYFKLGTGQDLLVGVKVLVPEPASLAVALFGAGGLLGYGARRRLRQTIRSGMHPSRPTAAAPVVR
ncbi:MAG: hypothetical protein KatS3mg108_2049 [Isosphaeraceae bacterium]|jgi:hypothetical protein|nr:MAG: hypothetical protein KatS3mg108_2049 [Isosphaeraceae bacterium]